MPAITARQVCTTALRLIGVAAAESPIEADMAQSALDALNALLDSWSTERLLMARRPRLTLPLVAGKQTYTWGRVEGEPTPADVAHPAPVRLELALLTVPGSPAQEWPITVLDQRQYETGIWDKQLPSAYPESLYLDPTRPYATLHVWPVPTMAYQLQLLPWPALPFYGHLDDVLEWPEGYLRMMQYGLAVDLAPQYGVEAAPTVQRVAAAAQHALFPVNATVGRLALFPGGGPGVSHVTRFRQGG